jgi:hypothetical protein
MFWPQSLWGNPMGNQGLGAPRFMPMDPSGLMPQSLYGSTPGLSPFAAAPAANPNLELQAMAAFMQDVTACSIRKLYDYLDKNSERHPQLSNCVPLVQQAAEAYRTRDYSRAFAQTYEVYRNITALRTITPDLPTITEQPRPVG